MQSAIVIWLHYEAMKSSILVFSEGPMLSRIISAVFRYRALIIGVGLKHIVDALIIFLSFDLNR